MRATYGGLPVSDGRMSTQSPAAQNHKKPKKQKKKTNYIFFFFFENPDEKRHFYEMGLC